MVWKLLPFSVTEKEGKAISTALHGYSAARMIAAEIKYKGSISGIAIKLRNPLRLKNVIISKAEANKIAFPGLLLYNEVHVEDFRGDKKHENPDIR